MNIFNSSKVEEEMNKDEMPLKYQEELKAHINKCMNVEAFPVFSSRIFEICKENKFIVEHLQDSDSKERIMTEIINLYTKNNEMKGGEKLALEKIFPPRNFPKNGNYQSGTLGDLSIPGKRENWNEWPFKFIVKIISKLSNESKGEFGNAYFIDDDLIVTAKHIVYQKNGTPYPIINIQLSNMNMNDLILIDEKVIKLADEKDQVFDWALIKTTKPYGKKIKNDCSHYSTLLDCFNIPHCSYFKPVKLLKNTITEKVTLTGFLSNNDKYNLKSDQNNIHEVPKNLEQFLLLSNSGNIMSSKENANELTYTITTNDSNSGSPVYIIVDQMAFLLATHSRAGEAEANSHGEFGFSKNGQKFKKPLQICNENIGVRNNDQILNAIEKYKHKKKPYLLSFMMFLDISIGCATIFGFWWNWKTSKPWFSKIGCSVLGLGTITVMKVIKVIQMSIQKINEKSQEKLEKKTLE